MIEPIPPIPEVPPALREAAQLTKLIPFVGAGAAKNLNTHDTAIHPTWMTNFESTALAAC